MKVAADTDSIQIMSDHQAPVGLGTFKFLRNGEKDSEPLDWESGPATVRKALGEALNAQHVAFLLGAGCSSFQVDKVEKGIPTMVPLAGEFATESLRPDPPADPDPLDEPTAPKPVWALTAEEVSYMATPGVSLEDPQYSRNLEHLMEALYSARFLLRCSRKEGHAERLSQIEGVIAKVKQFLLARCTDGAFEHGDASVLSLYQTFYRKLVLRDRSLPRPWVFTTNYDLFNERAMDRLGIPYANGFSGVVERRFNPATFRYALAEQLDLTNRKWAAVDAFVYLCKVHGSVSWTEDDHGLFPIREQWPSADAAKVMIYPTPSKQHASLASPYADLFREFQSRVVREQSVLVTAGYAFGDEHLNNIIYQALTIPTFRLIVFASPDSEGEIGKLRDLGDPRIWIIGGDGPANGAPAHYFATIVKHFMPELPADRIDDAVRRVLDVFGAKPAEAGA